MHTEISLSLTYTQKCASLRDIPHRLFSSFLPHIHRTLYWERWPTRTRCSAGCLTFCNKLYGKRTQKRLNMLHGYTIPESHDCILTTSTGWQTDCTPTYNRDEVKGKERKSMPVLLHTIRTKSKERRENQCLYSYIQWGWSQRKGEKINANFIPSKLPHLCFSGIPGAWVGLSPKAGLG